MATESQEQGTGDNVNEPEEANKQDPTPESGGNGDQPKTPVIDKTTKLPDDHPLVTAHATVKDKLAAAATELAEARAQSKKATELQAELDKRPSQEALDTLQTRYDRLEAFAQKVGLGKALDSRTFTRDLFESDKDLDDLVKEWNKANPSATSQALGGKAGGEASPKHNPNDLLRIAAGKK